ncbi:phosphatase PAP2 family protein [Microvirga sp. SRT01]|jgi:undecaprenyl-diphosphatase|uniref:Phosphatase PAP2 family protein n=1 Tax=Sphingomonas longa TaxID=2778730 RepID=A0ABS2D686_9SPHN|nr:MULTISPECIES: phosphatase PAP2 family protein [Alphaproteobacteria]MBM6576443.1 phosphatase PAP2 family protein [Sphingomonas sp. BT552]MBR7709489.1 phosphatase PAP2 family protein [Microvirga sp. SRT01]
MKAEGAHRRPLPPLLAGAATASVAVALLLIAGTLLGRWPLAWDQTILTNLRAWGGPRWLGKVAVDLTALGGGTVLTLAVALVAGLLLVRRLWLTAAAIVVACASGAWLVGLAKDIVGRTRPDVVAHLVPVSSASFPSAHAANSAIVYLTLAALASQVAPEPPIRRYLMTCAILLVGAIGLSRVYLGVHWPSDVLAGWSFGTLWTLGSWWATARIRASIGGER